MASTAPHTQAMLGPGETRERRSWAILDGRHRGSDSQVMLPGKDGCTPS